MAASEPRRNRILSLMGFACAVAAATSLAQTIDNFPPEDFLSALGEPAAPYFAQTFVAPQGIATELAVQFDEHTGFDDLEFRVLITDVTGYGPTFHPTAVLFEGPTIAFGGSAPTVVRVPLSGLTLVAGKRYAFVLDAFVTRDGLDGRARVGTNGSYRDGESYFNQALVGATRAEHFAETWYFPESIYPTRYHDLAFQLKFVPAARDIPATSELGLFLLITFVAAAGLTHAGMRSRRG